MEKEDWKTAGILAITTLIVLGTAIITAFIFTRLISSTNISLPKEYKAISKNHFKPDTLLGYYIDNKLYIEFKTK